MTAEQRKAVEDAASKYSESKTDGKHYRDLQCGFIAGAEFASSKLCKPSEPEYNTPSKKLIDRFEEALLMDKIEEAILTTLVVQNKQSIDIAVSKIVKLLKADI